MTDSSALSPQPSARISWRDYIKVEDLPDDYQLIVEAIGLEATIKLAEKLNKVPVYLKSPDKLFKPAKDAFIRARYAQAGPENPFDYRRVALDTGLSIREIYDIVEDAHERAKQQKLF